MEPGPAARGLTARVGVGRVTKVTVDMDTDIAAALVVGGGCSMAAN
jgi:hypothetical protein